MRRLWDHYLWFWEGFPGFILRILVGMAILYTLWLRGSVLAGLLLVLLTTFCLAIRSYAAWQKPGSSPNP